MPHRRRLLLRTEQKAQAMTRPHLDLKSKPGSMGGVGCWGVGEGARTAMHESRGPESSAARASAPARPPPPLPNAAHSLHVARTLCVLENVGSVALMKMWFASSTFSRIWGGGGAWAGRRRGTRVSLAPLSLHAPPHKMVHLL